MINTPNPLTIEPSDESIESWANRPYISETLRPQLLRANVLIVPREGYLDEPNALSFPTGTEELLQFLHEHEDQDLHVDICIDDSNYQELALHADLFFIASFVVTAIAAPVAADLISEYIKRRLGSRTSETDIDLEMTIHDERTRRSVRISYHGPASEYQSTMHKTINSLDTPQPPLLDVSDFPTATGKGSSRRRSRRKGKR